MTTSDSINELASALAKAQGEMGGAVKDSANPFFKSKYASLDSVWDACRGPLAKYEIAVVQSPSCDGTKVSIDTLLIHRSGQWMRGTLSVTAADDSPQAVGSAVTYGRRYALQAFAGVAPADDDGEAAQGRGAQQTVASTQQTVAPEPDGYADWLDRLHVLAAEGTVRLDRAWQDSTPTHKNHLLRTAPERWREFKLIAARRIA